MASQPTKGAPPDSDRRAAQNTADDTLKLAEREQRLRIAAIGELTDIRLRKGFAIALGLLFVALNVFACALVLWLAHLDQRLLELPASNLARPRVNASVLIALISGTAAQTGAALVVVARYLFPQRARRKRQAS